VRPVVPILAYHKVAEIPRGARYHCNYVRPAQFVAQLRLLRAAGFQSISLRDYEAHRATGARLPARPIIITFDDGYRCTLVNAAPLLREYGFSATVFVVSDLIGKTNCWDADEIQEPLLDVADLRELKGFGIDVQSHSRTHARLSALPPDELRAELRESKEQLEDITAAPVTTIAYPWGEYNATVTRVARDVGYSTGVILRRRTNFAHTPLLELRRIGVNHTTSLTRFAWDLFRLRWRGD
jgi:peptidoglycan/xylan/chitin deacetylase (PgdA/CDA1 family)